MDTVHMHGAQVVHLRDIQFIAKEGFFSRESTKILSECAFTADKT
jgi:hypothetical protein